MTAIDYPTDDLPLPLINKASHKERNPLLRTKMDSGYAVVRRRFTVVPVDFDLQLMLDQDSLGFFQDWFANILDYGVNSFNMEVPVGASLLSEHECRFIKNPKYTLSGQHWKVAMKIRATELEQGPVYDEVMLGVIESLGGFEDTGIYLDKLDVAINITYPSSGFGPGV